MPIPASPFSHLTHEIMLNRTYYAKSAQIISWLGDHVGLGYSHRGPVPLDDYSQTVWHVYQLFGHTVIRFANSEDLVAFRLSWC
jgi:hypothetical protein